jgi:hypothetical protein
MLEGEPRVLIRGVICFWRGVWSLLDYLLGRYWYSQSASKVVQLTRPFLPLLRTAG